MTPEEFWIEQNSGSNIGSLYSSASSKSYSYTEMMDFAREYNEKTRVLPTDAIELMDLWERGNNCKCVNPTAIDTTDGLVCERCDGKL